MTFLEFALNRCCSALSGFLPAAAFLLFSTSGHSAQLTQYYLPPTAPVTLIFRDVEPARAPIEVTRSAIHLSPAIIMRADGMGD